MCSGHMKWIFLLDFTHGRNSYTNLRRQRDSTDQHFILYVPLELGGGYKYCQERAKTRLFGSAIRTLERLSDREKSFRSNNIAPRITHNRS